MRILYYDNKCQVELVRKNKLKLPVSSPDINSMTTLHDLMVAKLTDRYPSAAWDTIAARVLLVLSEPSEDDDGDELETTERPDRFEQE